MKLAMSLILLSLVGCPVSYAQFANAIENEGEIIETLRKGLNAKTLRRIRGGILGHKMNIEEILEKELDCKLKPFRSQLGHFRSFETDKYGWVFVKFEGDRNIARPMFEGEVAGLNLLRSLNLPNVTIAKVYKIIDLPYMIGGACLVMDYLFTEDLFNLERQQDIGTALAHLHLHNARMKTEQPDKYVSKFGFHMPTYCGRIPYDNTWKDNWVDFIINNRLGYQIDLLRQKPNTEEATGLWDFNLKPFLHRLFENVTIEPALLHGDLWAGNAGQKIGEEESYLYDPAVFYGHHEYDLAITSMFPGFHDEFYDAYHALIPKSPGFENRQRVYKLFHWLNHWNHFAGSYRNTSLSVMKSLVKMLS